MKLCKDCKWFEPASSSDERALRYAKCNAPRNIEKSSEYELIGIPVAQRRWEFCSTHRTEPWLWAILLRICGKRGRWFEPKDTKS